MQNETPIQFTWKNQRLYGFLHQPVEPTTKIIIMHHGFTGTSIDAHFMFTRFARFLATQGIAVLRYDFVGSGNSTGTFAEMTFGDELQQAQSVLDEVITWPWVETIYLHGFSMGGAVASKLAGANAEKIAKLLLWSPAGTMPQLVADLMTTAPQLENGNYDCNGLELGKAFVTEMLTMDMFSEIARYQGPVQIIHGTQDGAIPHRAAELYATAYHQEVAIQLVTGADHTYSALKWLEEVFQCSKHFLLM